MSQDFQRRERARSVEREAVRTGRQRCRPKLRDLVDGLMAVALAVAGIIWWIDKLGS